MSLIIKQNNDNTDGKRTYTINKQEFASVSTIKGILDKPALMRWALNLMGEFVQGHFNDIKKGKLTVDDINIDNAKEYHNKVSSTACDIGTVVHDEIERYINSQLKGYAFQCSIDPIHQPEAHNAMTAFFTWVDQVHFKPIATEYQVYSLKYKFAGTVDCLARVNGKIYLLDWKSSKACYPEMGLQLAAYRIATNEMIKSKDLKLPIPQGIAVVRLDKETGLPTFKDYSKKYMKFKKAWIALCTFYYNFQDRRICKTWK